MSDTSANPETTSESQSHARPEYVVVARRYRPQTFDELIGQEHIARALSGAITTHRVGHAYLFTGARGVGKTSAARILAKALNCVDGPAPVPCNQCEICQSISSGEDVDVLEIDGASNRGIDEIRQLRQNVGVRPSRSRLKIYIIDEVHMLTREAFNALLKTLEEPPEHVKFIFCTTDPHKIPATILSRCQRFDFAGIGAAAVAERLGQIVQAEGVAAEPDALEVLGRRAAGSMRDGQSLLEQLLAFAPEHITLADVHEMLGTAGDRLLDELVDHLGRRDAAAALTDLDTALGEGVDVAQLLEQLFGYLRDCMTSVVGCPTEILLYASPSGMERVVAAGKQLGLQTLLAAMQILDQTLLRLRLSNHPRILAELALARICSLEDLDELPGLIAELRSGEPAPVQLRSGKPAPVRSGKPVPVRSGEPASAPTRSGSEKVRLTADNAAEIWGRVAAKCPGFAAEHAKQFDHAAIPAPNHLVVAFRSEYTFAKSACERSEHLARFQQELANLTGEQVRLEFKLVEEESTGGGQPARAVSPHQRLMQLAEHPMVRRAEELFGAEPTRVDRPPDRK